MSDVISGSCLCGKVKFELRGPFSSFFVCHCSRCRKATGSAHASNIFTKPEDLSWTAGEDLVRGFKLDSAQSFGRNFCAECGSPVPRVSAERNMVVIPAGSLDEDPGIRPENIIFSCHRAHWYDDISSAPRFAKYPDK